MNLKHLSWLGYEPPVWLNFNFIVLIFQILVCLLGTKCWSLFRLDFLEKSQGCTWFCIFQLKWHQHAIFGDWEPGHRLILLWAGRPFYFSWMTENLTMSISSGSRHIWVGEYLLSWTDLNFLFNFEFYT